MKILFTAPRFHTNQVPIVKGLIGKGHDVRFFAAFEGAIEDHRYCAPTVLKPSRYTLREKKRLSKTKSESDVESIIGGRFIPDFSFLKEAFFAYMPDAVICRERTNMTLCVYALCRQKSIPCILYDQEPVYPLKDGENGKNENVVLLPFFSRIQRRLEKRLDPDLVRIYGLRRDVGFPTVRMTPVEYKMLPRSLSLSEPADHTYFVPFCAEAHPEALHREYCPNGVCRFLCIGKFRGYKNVKLAVDAASLLKKNGAWTITLIGQASNGDERAYYEEVRRMIQERNLDDRIGIKINIPHPEMGNAYLNHDVLILPSKKEKASVSVVEAMSYGLPVISTEYNGTASYVEENRAGFVFSTDNARALADCMSEMMNSDISGMGKNALDAVRSRYTFENYYRQLVCILGNSIGR